MVEVYRGSLKEPHGYQWSSPIEPHKEKKSWTHLDGGHLYQENTPTDPLSFQQLKNTKPMVAHRLVFHILTAEGDLKDTFAIASEYTPKWGNGDVRDDIYKSIPWMTEYLKGLKDRGEN